ncbi:MAG: Xaa-Pro dipeptidyl-peptidase [Planctomycetota bacterium]
MNLGSLSNPSGWLNLPAILSVIVCLWCGCQTSGAEPPVAVPKDLHRSVLAGQSKLAGRGTVDDQDPAVASQARGHKIQQRLKDGLAAIMPAFKDPKRWLRHDLFVETPNDCDGDGRLDRIHVSVIRQAETEDLGLKVPAIVYMSPYYGRSRRAKPENFWDMRHPLGQWPERRNPLPHGEAKIDRPTISTRYASRWVPRGYAVVHASAPGTGLSQGCSTVGGENEYQAPKAVIDWLCGRAKAFSEPIGGQPVTAPWCTKKVAMVGTSYNGTLALSAATTGVAGLELVVPIAPNTSYYNYYRSNGLVVHPRGYSGEEIDVLAQSILMGNPDTWEACDRLHQTLFSQENLSGASGDVTPFWRQRELLPRIKNTRCGILMAHGFNDWNVMPEHSIRVFMEAKKHGIPVGLYMHQDGHGGSPPWDLMNRWLTHFLFGLDNGWDDGGRSWIVRENDKKDAPTRYPDYPHPDASAVSFSLSGGAPGLGSLVMQGNTNHATGPRQETLIDNFSFTGEMLGQAEWTQHRLIYQGPELKSPIHLSGTAKVRLTVSCNRPATNLSVCLLSLPWNPKTDAKIHENLITRGWFDPQNHSSLENGEPLQAGQTYSFEFDLQPDDQILPAGQRIALMVYGSDKNFTVLPDPGTELTLHLSKCELTVPIVGGADAYIDATNATANIQQETSDGQY